jgi:micrococcal nuclease
MQKFLPCVYLIVTLLFCSIGRQSYGADWYTIKWVTDGDTVVLKDGRKVRYIGINAPEIGHADQKAEPFGNTAKEFNEKLVSFKKVRLEFGEEQYDQYGRLLAYVFLQEETFVNKALLERGYAHVLPRIPNGKYEDEFLTVQRNAMSAGKGIWQNWKEKEAGYLGNRHSKRFHLKTCLFGKKTRKENRIFFSKKWDAFWAGFSPCKKCIGKRQ